MEAPPCDTVTPTRTTIEHGSRTSCRGGRASTASSPGTTVCSSTRFTESPVAAAIAGKDYDSKAVVKALEAKEVEAVIPSLKSRAERRNHDRDRCKDRSLAQQIRFKAKPYRRVATRRAKTARSFLAFVHVVSIMILPR